MNDIIYNGNIFCFLSIIFYRDDTLLHSYLKQRKWEFWWIWNEQMKLSSQICADNHIFKNECAETDACKMDTAEFGKNKSIICVRVGPICWEVLGICMIFLIYLSMFSYPFLSSLLFSFTLMHPCINISCIFIDFVRYFVKYYVFLHFCSQTLRHQMPSYHSFTTGSSSIQSETALWI